MSPKILVAFLAGLVVASGITFFVMRKPQPAAQPVAVQRSAVPQPAQAAPVSVAPAPTPAPSDVMGSNVPPADEEVAPARTKHVKPVARVARHEHHPVVIARAQTPAPVAVSPAPEPQQSTSPVQ